MINFLFGNIKNIIFIIIACFIVYLFRRNRALTLENKNLTENNFEKDKVINIQQKVLDVSENVKPTDLDSNLKRLSNKNN